MLNSTKNQHYISQLEQRFNAIDSGAPDRSKKIYRFEIKDRENFCLGNAEKIKIVSNASYENLFALHIQSKSEQLNLELFFGDVESKYKESAERLVEEVSIKKPFDFDSVDLLRIFHLKFLNILRNPFLIKKNLNTLKTLKKFIPADQHDKGEFFRSVINGNKPQIKHMSEKFNATEDEYRDWLASLWLMLKIEHNNKNMFYSLVEDLFTGHYVQVYFYAYEEESCVISDCAYSFPIEENKLLSFDFNLSSNIFVRFIFMDEVFIKENLPQFESLSFNSIKDMPVSSYLVLNDLDELKRFNQRTIYQSKSYVFCSSKSIVGAVQ